jgi:hypothetical protein
MATICGLDNLTQPPVKVRNNAKTTAATVNRKNTAMPGSTPALYAFRTKTTELAKHKLDTTETATPLRRVAGDMVASVTVIPPPRLLGNLK